MTGHRASSIRLYGGLKRIIQSTASSVFLRQDYICKERGYILFQMIFMQNINSYLNGQDGKATACEKKNAFEAMI